MRKMNPHGIMLSAASWQPWDFSRVPGLYSDPGACERAKLARKGVYNSDHLMMQDEKKTRLRARLIEELQRFSMIVLYLWALIGLFEIHKHVVLREQNIAYPYKLGFALVNAFILGKVVLSGEVLHIGEGFKDKPLIFSILLKAATFAVLLVCFEILEEVLIGVFHGKTIAQSIPPIGGGGLEGIGLVGFMVFVVFIPFFTLTEIGRVLGLQKWHLFLLSRRPKTDTPRSGVQKA
jgi:hypothetical protein